MNTLNDTVIADSNQNQTNRSGGPRTTEGKDVSRRNALKNGLRSKVIFPAEVEVLIEKRIDDFFIALEPRNSYEEVYVRDMAVSSARFERCAMFTSVDLVRVAERADSFWEKDRRMGVENYASKLLKEPDRISNGLQGSRQGAQWLIDNWNALADIARETGRWDESQRKLAFALLGVRRELRTGTSIVPNGEETAKLIAIAESEITRLRDDQETVLNDIDDTECALTMAGMTFAEDQATIRLRKNEARARNDFAKARNGLLRFRETQVVEKPSSLPESTNDRPVLSNAAIDNLVKRSQLPTILIEEEEEATVEVAEEAPATEPKVSHPNRRARKEQARRAREAGR